MSSVTSILLVDDEQAIIELISIYLKQEKFQVFSANTGQAALEIFAAQPIDLVVLDLMLPDMTGFEICQQIRANSTVPILMLTAKDDSLDKINGLTLGADDYLTKPFQPLELMARLKALLRRASAYNQPLGLKDSTERLLIGELEIDRQQHLCALAGRQLDLTPIEFDILWHLCQNANQVVSSEAIFYQVWGEEYFTSSNNTVMVHIRHLRTKMNDLQPPFQYIKTVWGVGYKIEK